MWAVAMAASAGGIQALRSIIDALPANFAATILIVQHLEPTRPSRLAAILDKNSKLKVTEARPGEKLKPGCVYTAPPDHHMIVRSDQRLRLAMSPRVNYTRPAADVLFPSVAAVFGERAIGVVLSGTGHDGAAGCVAIRTGGGVVIAQDEATSLQFGMPRSVIELGQADHVLPLEDIPNRIIQLISE